MASLSTAQRFDTFYPFSRLSDELRIIIWKFSLPAPRLIYLKVADGEMYFPGRTPNRSFTHIWASKLPVPTILHVNFEARDIGKEHYDLIFDTNERPAKEEFPDLHDLPVMRKNPQRREFKFAFETKAPLYVDLQRDCIVLHSLPWKEFASQRGLSDLPYPCWPIVEAFHPITALRKALPKEAYTRIRYLAATSRSSCCEIFKRDRYKYQGNGLWFHIYVVKNPFKNSESGIPFIDAYTPSGGNERNMTALGTVAVFRGDKGLRRAFEQETFWD